jgi:hypothetical protein
VKHLHTLKVRAVAAAAALALVPHAALAQTEPAAASADSAERVDALLERGIALRKAGNDSQALPMFQQAEQLEPDSVRVQVHLAATHQALGEWEAADRYLSRALERPNDPYIVKHGPTLAEARRTIDAHMATLEVTGRPAGAEVRLNGRLVGTLPLQRAVRLEAGIYALEVTLPGHYPVTRSVVLAGARVAHESVTLAPQSYVSSMPAPAATAVVDGEAAAAEAPRSTWLTWTLAGASVGAAAASVVFWAEREKHAEHWNDNDRCQGGGQTRGALCGDVLDAGERAEKWMYVTGAASLAFATGAVIHHLLQAPEGAPAPAEPLAFDTLACGIGLGSLGCTGRF